MLNIDEIIENVKDDKHLRMVLLYVRFWYGILNDEAMAYMKEQGYMWKENKFIQKD